MADRELCKTKSSTGLCYSEISSGSPTIHQSHQGLVNPIQGYVSNPEMVSQHTGRGLIGFSMNLQQLGTDGNSMVWKSFFAKPGNQPESSTSKMMNESTADFFQHDHFNKADQFTLAGISGANTENLIVGPDHDSATWQENRLYVDDSSIRCLLPCEGNERRSQGLSLSLSSSNPSGVGLEPFELRHTNHHQSQHDIASSSCRDHEDIFGNAEQQHLLMQNGFVGKSDGNHYQGPFLLKNSKYLVPAQELLNEFCYLGTKQTDPQQQKAHKKKPLEEHDASAGTRKQSVNSLDFVELQRRKTKLLSMLEEVDRRYRYYCNQMKAVVSSFESVAGTGAASVYSALASKAMSRHFRCLKDGILSQIKATRKAMGEKDPIAPGTTKGETPRLRVIDQKLRQQRAFQQMSMMESHPWRPQRGLPERSVSVLRAWLFEHFLHPYPSDVDKHILARQTGLSRSQVSNWFINARVRLWKPMVEDMYLEETKEKDNNMASSDGLSTDVEDNCRPIQAPPSTRLDDQKAPPDPLVRVDSDCLSSIINNPDNNNDPRSSSKIVQVPHMDPTSHQVQLGRVGDFGSMEPDFTSYNQHSGSMVAFGSENMNYSFNCGGVSLTLGLQQHGGSGVSLAFPAASQNSLFYPREHMEDCHPVQYSLLDAETQNLPYRNLMGEQLLHDLAG